MKTLKTLIAGLLCVCLFSSPAFGRMGMMIQEADGTPNEYAYILKMPNGTISITGSIATYTAAGGGDVTGITAGDGIRVDNGATATPDVHIDFDENTTNLEATAIGAADILLYMDSDNSDDMARGLISDLPFLPLAGGSLTSTVSITPATAVDGLHIDQDEAANAAEFDGDGSGQWTVYTHGMYGGWFEQTVVDGQGLYVQRNLGATDDTNPLALFYNQNAANTEPSVFINHDGTGGAGGYALHVDSENTAAPAVVIESADSIGLQVNGLSVIRGISSKSYTNGDTPTAISEADMRANLWINNQGEAVTETDLILVALTYPIKIHVNNTEVQTMEICPPAGEIITMDTEALDADDCVQAPNDIGAMATFWTQQIANGDWRWFGLSASHAWIDAGPADDND